MNRLQFYAFLASMWTSTGCIILTIVNGERTDVFVGTAIMILISTAMLIYEMYTRQGEVME